MATISELIRHLQEIQQNYGDVTIYKPAERHSPNSRGPRVPHLTLANIGEFTVSHIKTNLSEHEKRTPHIREWKRYIDRDIQKGEPILRIEIL